MGAQMRFFVRLIYPDAARARAAASTVPGRDEDCILTPEDVRVRGAQLDVAWDNVVGSKFFEGTCVALSALTEHAYCGNVYAVYCEDTPEDRESCEYRAEAPIPGCPRPSRDTEHQLRAALVYDGASLALAHERLKPRDVPALVAIHDAIVEPYHRARIAQLLAGRTEPAAQRVLAALAALAIDPADPWADELRAIQAAPVPVEPPRGEPFLVGWVATQAQFGEPARTENARAKVTGAILPMLAARYADLETDLERARLVHVLVGRPRIHNRPEVQAMIADLLARPIGKGADAAERRTIHAAAAAAVKAAKPARKRRS